MNKQSSFKYLKHPQMYSFPQDNFYSKLFKLNVRFPNWLSQNWEGLLPTRLPCQGQKTIQGKLDLIDNQYVGLSLNRNGVFQVLKKTLGGLDICPHISIIYFQQASGSRNIELEIEGGYKGIQTMLKGEWKAKLYHVKFICI